MKAITTFSDKGYVEYGRECLETFVDTWPCDIVVFYEKKQPDFKHKKIIYLPIKVVPKLRAFIDGVRGLEGVNGYIGKNYSYQWDAIKFSNKVFCQLAVKDDITFWLDADCITHTPIPEDYLRDLVKDVAVSCFNREGAYPETGFIGFNQGHPDWDKFRMQYEDVYMSGHLFRLPEWHDCYALQYALRGIAHRNLYPEGKGTEHVIAKSDLARFIDHKKGPRKKEGYSPESVVKWWERPVVPSDAE